MSITPRPTGAKPGDRPLPVKHRIAKHGVLIFELTKEQRAKLVFGYNVQVSVSQFFQHNPGHIEVQARMDVTPQTGFKPGDRLEEIDQVATIVREKKNEPGSESDGRSTAIPGKSGNAQGSTKFQNER